MDIKEVFNQEIERITAERYDDINYDDLPHAIQMDIADQANENLKDWFNGMLDAERERRKYPKILVSQYDVTKDK